MMPWGTDQTWEREDLEFDEPAGGLMFNKCLAERAAGRCTWRASPPPLPSGPRRGRAWSAELGGDAGAVPGQRRRSKTGNQPCRNRRRSRKRRSLRDAAPRTADRLSRRGRRPRSGPNPCGEPPAPEKKPPAQKPDGPPPTTARIGRPHAKGRFIATALDVTGAARASEHVFARIGGRRRQLCAGRSTRRSAGRLVVRCRLPEPALNRLAEGPLKLKVQIGFNPVLGESRVVGRSLTLARR